MQQPNRVKGLLSLAHREYLIRYSNGFKRHVSHAELLALDGLRQIGPREYFSQTLQHSLHITQELSGPNYLAGAWIVELNGKKYKDLPETVRGMVQRLAGVLQLQT